MSAKVVIASGGTGGHLFPAMGLAQDLKELDGKIVTHMIGGGGKSKLFLENNIVNYQEVTASSLSGKNPIKLAISALKILKGTLQAISLLRNIQPRLVVGMGSFYTFPVLAAAWLLRIPIYLHEGNAVLGKVNRLFYNSSRFIGGQFPILRHPKVTWMPLPLKMTPDKGLKYDAYSYFNLNPDQDVMLLMGGSQGAHFINAIMNDLAPLLKKYHLQIIHVTGKQEFIDGYEALYKSLELKASVRGFEKRMDLAWSIASFALVRAGAGSIAEIFEAKVPALLIPFPYAADNHQFKNAEFVVNEVKGGVLLPQDKLDAKLLEKEISKLYKDDKRGLKTLKENLKAYHHKMLKIACDITDKYPLPKLFAAKIIKDIEENSV